VRHVPHLLLGALLLGDVAPGAAVALEAARLIEDRPPAHADDAQIAVDVVALVHEILKRPLRRQCRLVRLPLLVRHVQAGDLPPRLPDVLFRAQGELVHPRGNLREAHVGVLLPVPVRGELRQVAEPRLALAQRRFRFLEAGHVRDGADQPGNRAVRPVECRLVVDGVMHLAIGGDDRRLVGLATWAAEQLLVLGVMLFRQLGIVGIELEHRFADEPLARNAEELFPCLVDPEISPLLGVLEKDRLGHRLDQLLDKGKLLAQSFGGARGNRVLGELERPLARDEQRPDDPEQQQAGHDPAQHYHNRQQSAGTVNRHGGGAEFQPPDASRHIEGHHLAQGGAFAALHDRLAERPAAVKYQVFAGGLCDRGVPSRKPQVVDDEVEITSELPAQQAADEIFHADRGRHHAQESGTALRVSSDRHASAVNRDPQCQ